MVPLSPRQRRIQQLLGNTRGRARQRSAEATARDAQAKAHQPRLDDVARLAFDLYLERGATPGDDWVDWFRAEAILKTTATPPPVHAD